MSEQVRDAAKPKIKKNPHTHLHGIQKGNFTDAIFSCLILPLVACEALEIIRSISENINQSRHRPGQAQRVPGT
jgi:hypothetical protein